MHAANQHGSAPPVGSTIGGAYRLVRFVGAGGMGAVYEAEGPQGRVAVKVLLHEALQTGGGEVFERFEREISVTGVLDSPHVVSLVDGGVDPVLGLPFMVMPLMIGMDLEQHIERHGPLHPIVAVRLVRQACRGVVVAHEGGVVHRDIKSANVFLDHDGDGRVTARVLDFGIAKWRDSGEDLTQTGTAFGTPHYMSPEQIKSSKHAGPQADLWSLAVTLYHALTGVVPFEETESITELMLSILNEPTPPLQAAAPWVDGGLARIVHGALLRDPDARCPSVADWARALEPFSVGADDVNGAMLVPLQPTVLEQRSVSVSAPVTWSELSAPAPGEVSATHFEDGDSVIRLEPDPLIGGTLGGRYAILRTLGSGGMGTVYEAVTPDGGRVAVKVLDPSRAGSAEAQKRFLREAKLAASIEHDNVVRVLDTGTDDQHGLPYIVMDLLVGYDLGDFVDRLGALSPEPAVRAFRQACAGLAAAHACDLVHRDIKLANLFLHQQPTGELVTKVCDFGLAKKIVADGQEDSATNLTRTGGVMGSPAYMSPEQAKSAKHVDRRTDVWSLGASLYQALAGIGMWHGKETVGEIIVAICTEPVPPIQDHAPWIPAGLAQVVHQAVVRDVSGRFATVDDLAAALVPFSGGSDQLVAGQLVAVSPDQRERTEARAMTGYATSLGGTNLPQDLAPPGRRFPGLYLAVGVALVAAASVGLWSQSQTEPAPLAAPAPDGVDVASAAASSSPSPSLSAASPKLLEVTVAVTPSTATVTVDGQARALDEGKLELQGTPGDSFEVIVTAAGKHQRTPVVITKNGTAMPQEITLAIGAGPTRPGGGPTGGQPISPAATASAQPKPGVAAEDQWR